MPGLVKEQLETAGARKALSIGIQYHNAEQYSGGDPPPMLQASHHDPDVLKMMLMQFYGYVEEDIVILKDDGKHTLPTRDNILKAIDELVKDAKAGDRFVFHYSGHGAQVPDQNGDEEDEMDEVIWPVDIVYDKHREEAVKNYIRDDDLKERLIDSLPAGTHLTIILDCCHSGTGVDLPYSGRERELDEYLGKLWSPISPKAASVAPFLTVTGATKNARGPLKLPQLTVETNFLQKLESVGDFVEEQIKEVGAKISYDKYVTSWAACVDEQLELEGLDGGLLTKAFWEVLSKTRSPTHQELIKAIAEYLVNSVRPEKEEVKKYGYGCPRPVLSSIHRLEVIHPLPFSF